jgi:hypothetical protein
VATSKPSRPWLSLPTFVLGIVLSSVVLIPLLRPREAGVDTKPVVRLQLTLSDDVTLVRGQPPAVSPDVTRASPYG